MEGVKLEMVLMVNLPGKVGIRAELRFSDKTSPDP